MKEHYSLRQIKEAKEIIDATEYDSISRLALKEQLYHLLIGGSEAFGDRIVERLREHCRKMVQFPLRYVE